jgi:hypothetical protein
MKFYKLVKTGGEWDFKNKSQWKLSSSFDYYTILGIRIQFQDIGNIHFGFIASVLFSWSTMCAGAGFYQIISKTSSWRYWDSFFDDPRDTFCITIGRALWSVFYRKCVYQW